MPITRVGATEALYETFESDGNLISKSAFDRNGEILEYEICQLEIEGRIKIQSGGRVDRSTGRWDCPICQSDDRTTRTTNLVSEYDIEVDMRAANYVRKHAPFYQKTSFLLPVSHDVRPCPNCVGSGDIYCADCNGSGEKNCRQCDGTGLAEQKKQCHLCAGEGIPNCPQCEGTGVVYVFEDCGACHGKGTEDCGSCKGKGSERCRKCTGAGKKHHYRGYSKKIEPEWYIQGLPSFWETGDHVTTGETVAELDYNKEIFEMTFSNDSFATISGPSAEAGAFKISYGTSEYHAMLVDNGNTRSVIFDPAIGPLNTSIGRRFHDLRSRLRGRLLK